MDKLVEGVMEAAGSRKIITRKPAQRDRRLNTTTTTPPNEPVVAIIPTLPLNRPLTERPSVIKPARQRKHVLPLVTVLTKLLAKKFKLVKDRALAHKRMEKAHRMFSIIREKRVDHLQWFLQQATIRMHRFRRLKKLARRLSCLFKSSMKVKYCQSLIALLRCNLGKAGKFVRAFQRSSVLAMCRTFSRIQDRRKRLLIDRLELNKGLWRKKLTQTARLARGITHFVRAAQAKAFSQVMSYAAPIQTKRKVNRRTMSREFPIRLGSTEPAQKPDSSKDKLIAELKAQLQEKTKRISFLQKELEKKVEKKEEYLQVEPPSSRTTVVKQQLPLVHSRSTTPQNIRINYGPQEEPDFDGSNSKVSDSHGPSRSHVSHERSSKSIRSCLSDNRSVFSENTMNLLKKLDDDTSPNNCCKYRHKYQQQKRLSQHLKQKLELMEEEYEMLSAINRHFDETLQIQLGPTLTSKEINQIEFESLKKSSEKLESQLKRCRSELEQTRRQKEKEREFFKAKLQSIYDKMSKAKRH